MASGVSQSLARSVLDAIFNGTAFTFTPYLARMTTASTPTAFGTEVSGGGYARQGMSSSDAAGNSTTTDATILWTDLPAHTLAGLSIVDTASGAPSRWIFIDGLSEVVTAGQNVALDPGAVIAQMV